MPHSNERERFQQQPSASAMILEAPTIRTPRGDGDGGWNKLSPKVSPEDGNVVTIGRKRSRPASSSDDSSVPQFVSTTTTATPVTILPKKKTKLTIQTNLVEELPAPLPTPLVSPQNDDENSTSVEADDETDKARDAKAAGSPRQNGLTALTTAASLMSNQ